MRWGILDKLEIRRAELCLTVDARLQKPSIVALFRRSLIYRVDLVADSECKPNPPDAWRFGLPARLCGSHTHPWSSNREHVIRDGFRELPYRKPIQASAITLAHALAIAAEDLNLTVLADQRDVTLPPQGALFGRSGDELRRP